MRIRSLALVVVIALVTAPACSRGEKDDNAFRLELEGRAMLTTDGAGRTLRPGGHTIAAGDNVRMLDGSAVLELPGDRTMLLRADDAAATEVTVGSTPDVVDGEAVVIAGEAGASVRAGDVEVELDEGAVRVDHRLSVTIAVYRGGAVVRSAGRELPGGLPALRQVSIAATGQLPRRAVALVYDDENPDPWDRRFLGEAIDLGEELDGKARGFTGQLGPRVTVDGSLLRRVLPPLAAESEFDDGLVQATWSPGESLVGAAIAVERGAGSFRQTWTDVFAFRADGARWGLVALDQQVKRAALLTRLDDAFGRSPLLFAAAPGRTPRAGVPRAGETTTTQPPTDGGGGGSTTTTTEPPASIGPITIPPTTVPPLAPPPPDGGGDGSPSEPRDPIDVIADLVDNLLGL